VSLNESALVAVDHRAAQAHPTRPAGDPRRLPIVGCVSKPAVLHAAELVNSTLDESGVPVNNTPIFSSKSQQIRMSKYAFGLQIRLWGALPIALRRPRRTEPIFRRR
jgi:hypothetical protein